MCLLAELYLRTLQPEKAIAIINGLEKVIFAKKEGSEDANTDNSISEKQSELWKLKLSQVSCLEIL